MDVRELKYFLRVAKDGSFSVAATKLYVSQPALSKVIHKMEEELGFPLFYTFQKKQRLTDQGAIFFDRAERVVDEYDSLIASANLERPIYQGQVAFGFPPMAGSCILSDIIVGFSVEHPGIKLSLTEAGATKVLRDIEANVLDIGYVIGPIRSDLFDATLVHRDENRVAVSFHNPLALRESVSLKDLANENFILHDADYSMPNTIYEAACKEGFAPNIVLRSQHWDFIYQAVRQNFGISVLPQSIFNTFDLPDVKLLTLEGPIRYCDLYIVTRKTGYVPGAVRLFCDYVKDSMYRKFGTFYLDGEDPGNEQLFPPDPSA